MARVEEVLRELDQCMLVMPAGKKSNDDEVPDEIGKNSEFYMFVQFHH